MLMLCIQTVSLITSFVIGFLISIPIGINVSNYDGACLLYSDVYTMKEEDTHAEKKHFHIKPGSVLTCNFCIFTGSVSLLLSAILAIGGIFMLCKHRYDLTINSIASSTWNTNTRIRYVDSKRRFNRKPLIEARFHFYASSGMSFLLFITACLISSGFHNFCEHGLKSINRHLKSCSSLEIYIGSFYTNLSTAQISSWIGTVTWVILAVVGKWRLKKIYPRRKNVFHSSETLGNALEEDSTTDL